MRKLLLAILLSLYIPIGLAQSSYQEHMQSLEPWNRMAVIVMPDQRRVPLGEHQDNPFPNKAACLAGLEADTETIFRWLMGQHVDITEVDVQVTCEPDEGKPL